MVDIDRRNIILSAASTAALATPFFIPSKANANPLILLAGIASRALVSTIGRMLIRGTVRSLIRNESSKFQHTLKRQGFSGFQREFTGDVLKEGFQTIMSRLQTDVLSGTKPIQDIPQFYGMIGTDPDFLRTRANFMKDGNVRQMPGYEIYPSNSRPALLNPIELAGLNWAISLRRREGWSEDKIASCYFPVGVADQHYHTNRGFDNPYQMPFHGTIQTPTGSISIRTRDRNFERFISHNDRRSEKIIVNMSANPYLNWCGSSLDCSDVFVSKRDHYKGSILDL